MTSATYRTFTGTGAENYQRYFVPAIAAPVSVELLRVAALQPAERVADVACGTGHVTRAAADELGPTGEVTGVDVAPDMIEVAAATAAPAQPEIRWHVGDAADLPIADGSCDVVLCQMGLMFMEDRPAALAEMGRVLAPGGRLVVNTPGPMQPAFASMEQAIVDHIDPGLGGFVRAVFSMDDPDEVAELVSGAGLTAVSATVTTTSLRLPPPAEFLWQYVNLTPMSPFVAQAPQAARSALERQVVDDWSPHVVDGRMPVDQPMVTASGLRPR